MASPLHHGVSLIKGQSTMAKTQMVQNIVCAEKLVTTSAFLELLDQAHHAAIDTKSRDLKPDETGTNLKQA